MYFKLAKRKPEMVFEYFFGFFYAKVVFYKVALFARKSPHRNTRLVTLCLYMVRMFFSVVLTSSPEILLIATDKSVN